MPVTNIANIAAVSQNTDGRVARSGGQSGPDPEFATATHIAEFVLEETRRGYFDNDPERFLSRFHLPRTTSTFDGTVRIETIEDLRAQYDMMRDVFARLGATDLIRVCVSARFLSPSKVQSTHMSYLMRDNELLKDPWPNHANLWLIGGRWMVADSAYAATEASVADALTLTEFSANRQTNDLLTQSASTHTTSNDHEDRK